MKIDVNHIGKLSQARPVVSVCLPDVENWYLSFVPRSKVLFWRQVFALDSPTRLTGLERCYYSSMTWTRAMVEAQWLSRKG